MSLIIELQNRATTITRLEEFADRPVENSEAALRLIRQIQTLFKDDPIVQHKAGVALNNIGEVASSIAAMLTAIALEPSSYFSYIELSDIYSKLNAPLLQRKTLLCAIDMNPEMPQAYYKAFELSLNECRYSDALTLAQSAYDLDPSNLAYALALAKIMVIHDRRLEAVQVYSEILQNFPYASEHVSSYLTLLSELSLNHKITEFSATKTGSCPSLAHHFGAAKLAMAFDRSEVVVRAIRREQSQAWLQPSSVVLKIEQSIRNRSPFSMIRIGDGEARFMIYCDRAVTNIIDSQEQFSIADTIWRNWFFYSIKEVERSAIDDLFSKLVASFRDADVLGLPNHHRLASDNLHYGYLAYMDNAIETMASATGFDKPDRFFADAVVHKSLNDLSNGYMFLKGLATKIAVISPHRGLAEKLANLYVVDDFVEYVIPGETRLPDGYWNISGESHFPNRYTQIIDALKAPQDGRIFLVAAGLLGKIYCHLIKESGGIALDIGSMADAWMGFDTRPGFFEDIAGIKL